MQEKVSGLYIVMFLIGNNETSAAVPVSAAENIASALERGVTPRFACRSAVRRLQNNVGLTFVFAEKLYFLRQ